MQPIFPESKSHHDTSGINVRGQLVGVHAIDTEVRLYERLFTVESQQRKEGRFKDFINPHWKYLMRYRTTSQNVNQVQVSDLYTPAWIFLHR